MVIVETLTSLIIEKSKLLILSLIKSIAPLKVKLLSKVLAVANKSPASKLDIALIISASACSASKKGISNSVKFVDTSTNISSPLDKEKLPINST